MSTKGIIITVGVCVAVLIIAILIVFVVKTNKKKQSANNNDDKSPPSTPDVEKNKQSSNNLSEINNTKPKLDNKENKKKKLYIPKISNIQINNVKHDDDKTKQDNDVEVNNRVLIDQKKINNIINADIDLQNDILKKEITELKTENNQGHKKNLQNQKQSKQELEIVNNQDHKDDKAKTINKNDDNEITDNIVIRTDRKTPVRSSKIEDAKDIFVLFYQRYVKDYNPAHSAGYEGFGFYSPESAKNHYEKDDANKFAKHMFFPYHTPLMEFMIKTINGEPCEATSHEFMPVDPCININEKGDKYIFAKAKFPEPQYLVTQHFQHNRIGTLEEIYLDEEGLPNLDITTIHSWRVSSLSTDEYGIPNHTKEMIDNIICDHSKDFKIKVDKNGKTKLEFINKFNKYKDLDLGLNDRQMTIIASHFLDHPEHDARVITQDFLKENNSKNEVQKKAFEELEKTDYLIDYCSLLAKICVEYQAIRILMSHYVNEVKNKDVTKKISNDVLKNLDHIHQTRTKLM